MENNFFKINISPENGAISSIVLKNDGQEMNWCSGISGWGEIRFFDELPYADENGVQKVVGEKVLPFVSFSEESGIYRSVYEDWNVRVTVERKFDSDGFLNEKYTVKNVRDADLFLEQGDLSVAAPFNDIYTYADDCVVHRCNTHIWCAGNTSYISAVKMGVSEHNLGLILTDGAFASYSLSDANKFSRRGVFLLDCEHIELLPDEEYVWNLKLFPFKTAEEFERIIKKYHNTVMIKAEKHTVFTGEKLRCKIEIGFKPEKISAFLGETKVAVTEKDGEYYIEETPRCLGDVRLTVYADGVHTFAEFYISEQPETVIKKRLHFIAEKQQYKRRDSALYGAFLPYDNKNKYLIFSSLTRDHNACRERVGMALLMCRYLQNHKDAALRASLDDYVAFALREFFDAETGEVFDGIGKNKKFTRLYNIPWMVSFFTEMYNLTNNTEYLEYSVRGLDFYYTNGGYKFYPNAFSMLLTYNALKKAGMNDACERVKIHFKKHADNIAKNGLSYPRHEVNYEQTIVTPAVTILSEFAQISGDDFYLRESEKHINLLKRFNGNQPSCHMNETPIRYWDDFWFGSARMQGDTFPHYWSCLTARAYCDYCSAGGDKKYLAAADECIRNCFCLFNEKGEGSCAYVYPYKVNGSKGAFYDDWANDQDFALYFYMTMYDI